MFNQFSEIEIFFKNSTFTQKQLDELKCYIINKYKEKELIKSAFTQIDLHLLKFSLKSEDESITTCENNHFHKQAKNLKRNNKKIRKPNLDKKYICESTKTSLFRLNTIIKKKKVEISDGCCFTKSEYKAIKGYIESRNRILLTEKHKYDKIDFDINTHNVKSSNLNSDDVYSKIKRLGGIGKLIYIRSK